MYGRHLVLGFALLAGLGAGGASANYAGCNYPTQWALQAGEYYLWGLTELWRDTNGIEGLQRGGGYCLDGRVVPADTCFTRTEVGAVLGCASNIPTRLA